MSPTILLVDDDENFHTLVEWAIRNSRLDASLQWVPDGDVAIAYLSRDGRFKDESAFPPPAMVLLDLNMPRISGFEVLQWKSGRLELSGTPFFVLSSSELERDKMKALELGALHYFLKPVELPGLIELFETLNRLWNRPEFSLEQIFLRDSISGKYFKSPDGWVSSTVEATRFDSENQALAQRAQMSKSRMELLVLDRRGRLRSGVRLWTE